MASVNAVSSASASRILIPEIIHRVFEDLPRKNLVRPALVCRSWSELALDVLWRELEELVPLLKILAPMCPQGSIWVFEYGLADANWDRFSKYCNRVRVLLYRGERTHGATYPTGALAREDLFHLMACMPHTQSHIFPHLGTLEWASPTSNELHNMEFVLPLMTPTVHRLRLAGGTGSADTASITLRLLGSISRISSGQLLHLLVDGHFDHWNHPSIDTRSLALCLKRNPGLRVVRLPICFPGSEILQALCSLKGLRDLHFNLTCILLGDLSSTLNTLVQNCPFLKELCVGIFVRDGEDTLDDLRFDHLRALLQLGSLTHLSLNVPTCVYFDSTDVIAMAQAWPRIEVFRINGREDDEGERTSTTAVYPALSILANIAQNFSPTLSQLELPLSYSGHMGLGLRDIHLLPNLRDLALELGDTVGFADDLDIGELLGHMTALGAFVYMTTQGDATGVWERIAAVVDLVHRARQRATVG